MQKGALKADSRIDWSGRPITDNGSRHRCLAYGPPSDRVLDGGPIGDG